MIITIDGPAGSGKSTVAKAVAKRYGIRYLDTGAMYRAAAWKALREGVPTEDAEALAAMIRKSRMVVDEGRIEIDGRDISGEIRTEEISQTASIVSVHPAVRKALVELQKRIGENGSIVTEGRDQGSVVFPGAEHKFFLVANVEERARRRHRDVGGDADAVLADLVKRDERDRGRSVAPLICPEGALEIDTTELTVEQVIERIVQTVGPPA